MKVRDIGHGGCEEDPAQLIGPEGAGGIPGYGPDDVDDQADPEQPVQADERGDADDPLPILQVDPVILLISGVLLGPRPGAATLRGAQAPRALPQLLVRRLLALIPARVAREGAEETAPVAAVAVLVQSVVRFQQPDIHIAGVVGLVAVGECTCAR